MKRILFVLIALCFANVANAASQLQWGIDRTTDPATICLFFTSVNCLPTGTIDPSGNQTIIVGPAQSADLKQLVQVSGAYPIPKQSQDMVRAVLGNFPADIELSSPTNGSFSNWAVVGATSIPAGDFTGAQPTWPSGGGAFYGYSNNAAVGTVGVYAAAGTNVANAILDGVNAVATNCPIQKCVGNSGFDFQTAYGIEPDVVIEAKPDGSAPTGQVAGVAALLNAAIQNNGPSAAFLVGSVNLPWKTGLASNNGTAITGISLGATSATGPANSQAINQVGLSSGGAPLLVSQFVDSLGGWNVTNNTAQTTTSAANAFPQWRQDAGASTQVGNKISTTATGTAQVESIMQTGSVGSSADFLLNNGANFNIQSGNGVSGGIIIAPAVGGTHVMGTLGTTDTISGPSLSVTGAAGLNQTMFTQQNLSGVAGAPLALNSFQINGDTATAGANFINAWTFLQNFGGTGAPIATGGRETVNVIFNQTAKSDPTTGNRNYVALVPTVQTSTGDGGTGLTRGPALGEYFSINPNAVLLTGAVNVDEITTAEFDTGIQAGASARLKYGITISGRADDAVNGAQEDAMIGFVSQGVTGCTPGTNCSKPWLNGLRFTNANGQNFPIATTGSILSTTTATVANVIDASNLTTTGFLLKGAGGVGITGAGILALPTYTFTQLSGGTIGFGQGRQVFCSDCLKPGETTGLGTGMMAFDDGHTHFVSTAGTVIAH